MIDIYLEYFEFKKHILEISTNSPADEVFNTFNTPTSFHLPFYSFEGSEGSEESSFKYFQIECHTKKKHWETLKSSQ